jgi:hypothetical protein
MSANTSAYLALLIMVPLISMTPSLVLLVRRTISLSLFLTYVFSSTISYVFLTKLMILYEILRSGRNKSWLESFSIDW